MELTEKALDYLQEKGYEPSYGARPLKRLLQRELVNSWPEGYWTALWM